MPDFRIQPSQLPWTLEDIQDKILYHIDGNNPDSFTFNGINQTHFNDVSGHGAPSAANIPGIPSRIEPFASTGLNSFVRRFEPVVNGVHTSPTVPLNPNYESANAALFILGVVEPTKIDHFEVTLHFNDDGTVLGRNNTARMQIVRERDNMIDMYTGGSSHTNRNQPGLQRPWPATDLVSLMAYENETLARLDGNALETIMDDGGNPFGRYYIPNQVTIGGTLHGAIGEIIYVGNGITHEENLMIEGYLKHKWDTNIYIGWDHPYNDNPPTKAIDDLIIQNHSIGTTSVAIVGHSPDYPFLDPFEKVYEPLENSILWERVSGTGSALVINANSLRAEDFSAEGSVYLSPDTGSTDHYVEFDVMNIFNSSGPAAICRYTPTGHFIGVRVGYEGSPGRIEVHTRVHGTLSLRWQSALNEAVVGDRIRMEVEGSQFRILKNGVQLHQGPINATLLEGVNATSRAGLISRAAWVDPWIDNYGAGRLSYSDDAELVANGISQAHVTGSPVLGHIYTLSANGLSQSAAVSNPVIGQNHVVSIPNIVQSYVTGSPLATHRHVLFVTNVSASYQTGTPSIGQSHMVVATNVSQPNVISPVTLVQNYVFAANGIHRTYSMGAPRLAQGHNITANSVSTSYIITGTFLTQISRLTTSNISVPHTIGIPSVGQVHGFSTQNIFQDIYISELTAFGQEHRLDTLGLVQNYILETPVPHINRDMVAGDLVIDYTTGSPNLGHVYMLFSRMLTQTVGFTSPNIVIRVNLHATGYVTPYTIGSPNLDSMKRETDLITPYYISEPSLYIDLIKLQKRKISTIVTTKGSE